jgi:hypothetical protein
MTVRPKRSSCIKSYAKRLRRIIWSLNKFNKVGRNMFYAGWFLLTDENTPVCSEVWNNCRHPKSKLSSNGFVIRTKIEPFLGSGVNVCRGVSRRTETINTRVKEKSRNF